MKPISPQDLRIAEEAATWLLRLEEDDSPDCQARFVAWIRESARHLHEFLLAKAVAEELNGADAQRHLDLSALGTERTRTVAVLTQHAAPDRIRPASATAGARTLRRPFVGALAATLVAAVFVWLLGDTVAGRFGVYSTAVGEQRAVKLADGSVVHLNTRSRVQVRMSADAREVKLLAGEALFAIEPDPARPFRVIADELTIQVLGTRFNVYRQPGSTTVSVLQGRVRVANEQRQDIQELAGGEEALIAQTGRIDKHPVPDITRRIAWRDRQLVFRSETLQRVVDEFNRYNRVQIRIEDASVGARAMSGVFEADDPRPLIEFLEEEADLHVIFSADEILVRLHEGAAR